MTVLTNWMSRAYAKEIMAEVSVKKCRQLRANDELFIFVALAQKSSGFVDLILRHFKGRFTSDLAFKVTSALPTTMQMHGLVSRNPGLKHTIRIYAEQNVGV